MDKKKFKNDKLYNWLTCPISTSGFYNLVSKQNNKL